MAELKSVCLSSVISSLFRTAESAESVTGYRHSSRFSTASQSETSASEVLQGALSVQRRCGAGRESGCCPGEQTKGADPRMKPAGSSLHPSALFRPCLRPTEPLEAVLMGQNEPGRARTVANRTGTALTGAVRTGLRRTLAESAEPRRAVNIDASTANLRPYYLCNEPPETGRCPGQAGV